MTTACLFPNKFKAFKNASDSSKFPANKLITTLAFLKISADSSSKVSASMESFIKSFPELLETLFSLSSLDELRPS
jgi:hypothetical protein